MYSLGVINGYNAAQDQHSLRVGAGDPITREQAATILCRLAKVMGKPLTAAQVPFTDPISTWAQEAVSQVYGSGIMGGYTPSTFGSRDSYTTEQSILTMLRTFRLAPSL